MGWFSDATDWVGDKVGDVFGGGDSGWVSGAVSIGGSLIDYFASEEEKDAIEDAADRQEAEALRVALANKKISLYDARIARRIGMNRRFEADAKAGMMYDNLQALLAAQRTRYAKSGVALKSGTPITVMENTTRNAAKDIMNIKYKGKTAQQEANDLAERYKLLGNKGLRDAAATSALIQETAADRIEAKTWEQRSGAVSNLYEWFK